MNRRQLVIGLLGLIVLVAVLIGVAWQSHPVDAITVRFHSFSTNFSANGTSRSAWCVVSNTTSVDFVVSVSTEYMTNRAFPTVPMLAQPNNAWGGREHGMFPTDLAPGSNCCRFAAQYRSTPMSHLGVMFEPLRQRFLGERPIRCSYSEEFHTPP